jgi:E3 ubiquitin-protein ligase BRE1
LPDQAANARVERLRKAGGGGGAEAEGELDALRTLLRCSVCHERQKSVILTKCWHMFCAPCIKRNLDSRHRKCPGCGAAFGAHDVKHFYFT